MKPTLLIIRRELGAYLRSPMGWVVISVALLIHGLLFNYEAMGDTARKSADVLARFFFLSFGLTNIAALFLSMRLIAEERQTGTLNLLYSSPVREVHIVLGKFLAALFFLSLMIAVSVYMPLLILVHGKIAPGHIAVGYLGVFLSGAAALAIGLFASSLTKSQMVAIVIAAAIDVFLVTCWFIGANTERPLNEVFTWMALYQKHFPPFQRGLLNTQDVVYYLSITYFFLFASSRTLEARRWS